MILYFSATGNNKYIAESIAAALGDTAVSMEGFDGSGINLAENEALGIVTPTYFLELPPIVKEFLTSVSITLCANNYVFGVVTYGSTSGACGIHLKKGLQRQNVQADALFTIITPDTWTVQYDLSDPVKVRRTLEKTDEQLSKVIERLKEKKAGDFRERKLPYALTAIYDPLYERARRTSHFHVENTCIGCGLCEKKCPVKAIRMENGRPVWAKEQCYVCFRCLHSCPKFAIQYGNGNTKNHGQYRREKYR